jgi:hypothetical protein
MPRATVWAEAIRTRTYPCGGGGHVLILVLAWAAFALVLGIALFPERRGTADEPSDGRGVSSRRTGAKASVCRLSHDAMPTLFALVLATCSLPLVALTLGATPGDARLPNDRLAATDLGRWSAAASAVFVSALVAGTICAPAAKRHSKAGAFLAFLVALLVAIPALPLLPALLGQSVGAGFLCLGACSDVSTTSNLTTGVLADLAFPFAPFLEPVPILTLAVGVGTWTRLVRRYA